MTSVIHVSYDVTMVDQIRKTSPTLPPMPKQTRTPMVVVNFRVPEDVKRRALERAEREGINLTDALREFMTEWADKAE